VSGQLSRAYLVPAGGGEPREVPIPRGQPVSDANWSPDGSRICFDNGSSSADGRHGPNIHVFDIRAGAVSDVPGSEEYFSARWSPDGRYLTALNLDSSRLALFDFSTGQWRELGRGGFYSFPAWSHDSRAVYYIQGTPVPAVMRSGLDNRPAERVVDLREIHLAGFYGSSLSLTPDDQPVLTRDAGAQEVYELVLQAR
jgi:WD40 repeat protein